VHDGNGVARSVFQSRGDCQLVSEVPRKAHYANPLVQRLKFPQDVGRRGGASVIPVQKLELLWQLLQRGEQPAVGLAQYFLFVQTRHNDGNHFRHGYLVCKEIVSGALSASACGAASLALRFTYSALNWSE